MRIVVPNINSLSSSLILGVTVYRNQPRFKNKCLAQVGYASITISAIVESIVALTCCIASIILYPISRTPFENSTTWLKSSSFTIIWAATDFVLNPFVLRLVADESSARQIARTGKLFNIPIGAVL